MNLKLLPKSLRTAHNQIVLCGLLVGLWYLPNWLWVVLHDASQGAAFPLIVLAAAYFAAQELWRKRNKLAKLIAPVKYRSIGHILILTGVAFFPFCSFAYWSQTLLWFLVSIVWLLVLVGIALSSWGLDFFKKYPRLTYLILLSVNPRSNFFLVHLWRFLTPHNMLERFMAWSGSLVLQTIGQPATSTDIYISLPTGGVKVGWGCNGFDMALTMAATSLLLGVIIKQSWWQTVGLVILGIALALVLNVPRIVLLTLAAVFWGDESFEFWHGAWGGQIFSGVLFTAYYYLAMIIYPRSYSL